MTHFKLPNGVEDDSVRRSLVGVVETRPIYF
jgi:hypothetical protein